MGKERRIGSIRKSGSMGGIPLKICLTAAAVSFILLALAGCRKTEESERTEVDFQVVTAEEIPEELSAIIEENKENEMRLTWTDQEEMYLIRGYGKQATGGYSVGVAECTEDADNLWFDTRLIGPQGENNLSKEPSFPYLVVKIDATEKNVIIE